MPTRALPSSRSAARTSCQHPSRPCHKMLGANAPSLPGWHRLQEEGRACIPSCSPYTWEGPGAQPRPSRPPAPPQIHRAQPPPGVLEPAGTGGLSSSILGSTSSYASSKAPRGTFSKAAPSSCHPRQECGVPGLTWFALGRAFLLLLLAPGRAFLPRWFKLQPVARNIQAGWDSQLLERGCRRRRGCPWGDEPRVRPVGPGRPPPAFLSCAPLERRPHGCQARIHVCLLATSTGGEGDRRLTLESTGDLLWGGRARLGADMHSHTSHTHACRQDHRLLCPQGKGLLHRGCLAEEGRGPLAVSTWEAGPGAGRARRPVHPHGGHRDADAPLGAPRDLPGCVACPWLSQDPRLLCLWGPGQRGRRSAEGDRPPHTPLCRPAQSTCAGSQPQWSHLLDHRCTQPIHTRAPWSVYEGGSPMAHTCGRPAPRTWSGPLALPTPLPGLQ